MTKYLVLFFWIPLFSFSQNCPTGEERIESIQNNFEKQVLLLTNVEREKRGLKPLEWDGTLAYAARYHAKDMAIDNYFDHDSYDRKGKILRKSCSIFDRIEAFIEYPYLAENISAGRTGPEEVVKAWMKSTGHRKNILDKNMARMGVGYYYSEDSEYGHYWVQNFGGD
jgi:uncharacterized protein YkwD